MILPRVVDVRRAPEGTVIELDIASNHPAFHGHFPDQAMLPGVAQLGWSIQLATLHLEGFRPGPFQGVDQLKFMRVIRPGTTLQLTLSPHHGALQFRYSDARGVCSSGKVRFAS